MFVSVKFWMFCFNCNECVPSDKQLFLCVGLKCICEKLYSRKKWHDRFASEKYAVSTPFPPACVAIYKWIIKIKRIKYKEVLVESSVRIYDLVQICGINNCKQWITATFHLCCKLKYKLYKYKSSNVQRYLRLSSDFLNIDTALCNRKKIMHFIAYSCNFFYHLSNTFMLFSTLNLGS